MTSVVKVQREAIARAEAQAEAAATARADAPGARVLHTVGLGVPALRADPLDGHGTVHRRQASVHRETATERTVLLAALRRTREQVMRAAPATTTAGATKAKRELDRVATHPLRTALRVAAERGVGVPRPGQTSVVVPSVHPEAAGRRVTGGAPGEMLRALRVLGVVRRAATAPGAAGTVTALAPRRTEVVTAVPRVQRPRAQRLGELGPGVPVHVAVAPRPTLVVVVRAVATVPAVMFSGLSAR